VSFIPGDVHVGWPGRMPEWMYGEREALVGAAQLLRRYHDAVIGFEPPPQAHWRFVAPGPHELICHNDWAPFNAVFRGRIPVAMLDWDSAGPGTREWDVARSALSWVPLYRKAGLELDIERRSERFALFCEAYGLGDRKRAIFDTLLVELPFFADAIQAAADGGDPGFAKLAGWGVPARLRAEASLLRQQRDALTGRSRSI
jgi:Ser/Thr protein kinase RdoA (MazF antagonist)